MAMSLTFSPNHVEDANGNPYVGAKLYVYAANTTTLASIFSNEALSTVAANPLTSDAAGNFDRFYIAAGTYKLRAETASGTLIRQEDYVDTGLPAQTGALPISRGGTGATTAAAARAALDVPSNSEFADLAGDISDIQSSLQNVVSIPQGYLTPTSGVPIIITQVVAGTAVYYTPYNGNLIPIFDGVQFNIVAFDELTLTLNAAHLASKIYDVFVFLDDGEPTIATGPAWTTETAGSGARGTGAGTTELVRTNGLLTNKYSLTARNGATTYTIDATLGTYVGSLLMDGTNGQITCHRDYGQSRKWGIWNCYNKAPIVLSMGDGTASWTNAVASIVSSNGSASNKLTVFTGQPDCSVNVSMFQHVTLVTSAGTGLQEASFGLGLNSVIAYTVEAPWGTLLNADVGVGTSQSPHVAYTLRPTIGANVFNALEKGNASVSTTWTFYGTEKYMLVKAEWWG